MKRTLILPFLILSLAGCQNNSAAGDDADAKRIDSSMRTVFVPVPNHPGEPGDNIIYAASFALAWQELGRILGGDPESTDPLVRRLNEYHGHEGALRKGSYTVHAQVSGETLQVRAVFSKKLPFDVPFGTFPDGMRFNKENVEAFGMKPFQHAMASQISVPYYQDDDHFVIRIVAGPDRDEMTLAKGFAVGTQLGAMEAKVERAIASGVAEMKSGKQLWKYTLNGEDEVCIPKMKLHLYMDYRELIGLPVVSRGETLLIEEARQRTFFELDEKGVIVESEAVVASVDSVATEKPPVKLLYFDKPYLIMMKEKGAEHPYFIMKVANSDWMRKKKE